MQNVEILGPFLGKVVTDITEHTEDDPFKDNETYIQVTFDDDSWIKFPRYDPCFWFKLE